MVSLTRMIRKQALRSKFLLNFLYPLPPLCVRRAWWPLAAPSVECHSKDCALGVQRRTASGVEVPRLPVFPETLGTGSAAQSSQSKQETTLVVSRPGKAPDVC